MFFKQNREHAGVYNLRTIKDNRGFFVKEFLQNGKQIRVPVSLHTSASYLELPYNINLMVRRDWPATKVGPREAGCPDHQAERHQQTGAGNNYMIYRC